MDGLGVLRQLILRKGVNMDLKTSSRPSSNSDDCAMTTEMLDALKRIEQKLSRLVEFQERIDHVCIEVSRSSAEISNHR